MKARFKELISAQRLLTYLQTMMRPNRSPGDHDLSQAYALRHIDKLSFTTPEP